MDNFILWEINHGSVRLAKYIRKYDTILKSGSAKL